MPRFPLKIIALATLAAYAVLPWRPASALTVSPVLMEYDVAPGGTAAGKIMLINESEARETYTLSEKNFIASGEEGAQQYVDEATSTGLASWIRADQSSVTLDPKTSREFPFMIVVPADAEPGGHYATIFFARGAGAVKGSGVGIAEEVGVLLLVNVPGNVRESLEVASFRVAGPTATNRLPVAFELRVKNTGSVHERPAGTIDIRNMLGNLVVRVDANPKRAAILPSSVRRLTGAWTEAPLSEGHGFFTQAADEWRNFGFGKYTATIDAAYGSHANRIASSSVSFWIIPWHLILIALGILIALIVLIAVYNRMLIRAAL
jgi:hypothetical protein